jgi:hypothetical protein
MVKREETKSRRCTREREKRCAMRDGPMIAERKFKKG